MGIFSDESILLIKNWEAVRDIVTAEKRLCSELTKFLYSIEDDLKNTDWWQNWRVFTKHSSSEVSITKRDWLVKGEPIVLIGVESFLPESFFGFESQATLYIYVAGRRHDLARKLAEKIAEREDDVIGEIEHRVSTGYVVRHTITQCLPEEINSFEDMARSQIINFLTHYTSVLDKYNELIKESLAED